MLTCPLCDGSARPFLTDPYGGLSLHRCEQCGVHFRPPRESSSHGDHFTDLDMAAYNHSVRAIREATYPSLVETVRGLNPQGRWLDVGCSFGWLLPFVHGAGYETYGLDPSPSSVEHLKDMPYHVTLGAYPAQDGGGAPYEVMSFIEVVEHLPNPLEALRHAYDHLKPGGVLVVSLPDQSCALYPLSLALFRASRGRLRMPLERLYLEGFDFPHLFYHHARSLTTLIERAGFRMAKIERIPAGRVQDTWQRVTYVEAGKGASLTALPIAAATASLMAIEQVAGFGGTLRAFAVKPRQG